MPAGQPSMRRCSAARSAGSSTMSWRSQNSLDSSSVNDSWAARTSCNRPVSRSRCSPIGGSNRQPRATRTRPSAHSTRCWMPSSTSRVRTSCTSSRMRSRPGTSSPSTPTRFATNVESAGPAGPAGATSPASTVAESGAASAAATMTALQKAVLSSSRSQVTQATGAPAALRSSAKSASIVVLPYPAGAHASSTTGPCATSRPEDVDEGSSKRAPVRSRKRRGRSMARSMRRGTDTLGRGTASAVRRSATKVSLTTPAWNSRTRPDWRSQEHFADSGSGAVLSPRSAPDFAERWVRVRYR